MYGIFPKDWTGDRPSTGRTRGETVLRSATGESPLVEELTGQLKAMGKRTET